MANEVIKKDGTKVPFDVEKIKRAIAAAAAPTALPEERKAEVVNQVSATVAAMIASKAEVTTIEIRELALVELDKVEPSVSEAWRKYDAENKAEQGMIKRPGGGSFLLSQLEKRSFWGQSEIC